MELLATILVSVGIISFVAIQLIAMVLSFTRGIGEVLRVFLVPGYALWISCTDETWAKWTLGTGASSLLLGLIILSF